MTLDINNPETVALAEELARLTGETKTQAVNQALRERLARLRHEGHGRRLADELDEIALHCSRLPVRDQRSADTVLGCGDDGLPR